MRTSTGLGLAGRFSQAFGRQSVIGVQYSTPLTTALSSRPRHLHSHANDTLTMTLPSVRTLAYAEYGSPTGTPLLFFHGYPSSRLEGSAAHEAARQYSVRLIAPDRPGFGHSSPQPGRKIMDWPEDVRHLLDYLELEKAGVLGGSGGGPYALACAAQMPERLSAVGLLASAPPWTVGLGDMPRVSTWSKWAMKHTPGLIKAATNGSIAFGNWMVNRRAIQKRMDAWLARADPTMSSDKATELRDAFLRMCNEGFIQGSQPMIDEAELLTTDWGIKFEDIEFGPVRVWHGEDDARSPIRMIKEMTGRIPHGSLNVLPTGHFGIHTALPTVFATLRADALGPPPGM